MLALGRWSIFVLVFLTFLQPEPAKSEVIERTRYGDWVIIDYHQEGDAICSAYVASDHASPSYVVVTRRGYIEDKNKHLELALYIPKALLSLIREEQEIALQIGGDFFVLIQQEQDGEHIDGWFFLEDEKNHESFMERVLRGWRMSLSTSSVEESVHIYSLLGVEDALDAVNSC